MKKMILIFCLIFLFVSVMPSAFAQGTSLKPGDTITFGRYEQDNDSSNGPEEIEWLIIDEQDGKALLLSSCILDCKEYCNNYPDQLFFWDNCYLHEWLINEFYESAFSNDEKKMIQKTTILKTDFEEPHKSEDLVDPVFILSYDELRKYRETGIDFACTATEFAQKEGVPKWNEHIYSWWLRGLVELPYVVDAKGNGGFAPKAQLYQDGTYKTTTDMSNKMGVRPAIWIDLNP